MNRDKIGTQTCYIHQRVNYWTLLKWSAVLVECGANLDILIISTDGSSQEESRDPPCSYGRI